MLARSARGGTDGHGRARVVPDRRPSVPGNGPGAATALAASLLASLVRGTPRAAPTGEHDKENADGPQDRTVSAGGNERQDVRRTAFLFARRDGERYRQARLHRRPACPRY